MLKKESRTVCFVITSLIHYSRNFLILDELEKRDDIELHIIIGGTALIPRYSAKNTSVRNFLDADGHKNVHEAFFNMEGDSAIVKTKTTGIGISEFASLFNSIVPDIVVVRGDRFEVFSAVIAAAYMDIPIAHIEGGDLSGTLDESVRHAITKMSNIHFTTNELATNRVVRMGEHPNCVFNFGSPDVEVVQKIENDTEFDVDSTGSGLVHIDVEEKYIVVMFHPVTTESSQLKKQTQILLNAVQELGVPTFWFWPNSDTGSEEISGVLRTFNDKVDAHNIKFVRYLPPRTFLSILRNTNCFVGNSSAGIKECSVLGIPVVNIGSRQNNRLKTANITDVDFYKDEIVTSISAQLEHGNYVPSDVYSAVNTSKNIANTLATIELNTQKAFHE